MALARVAMLCNRAEFKAGQEGVPVLKRSVSTYFLVYLKHLLVHLAFWTGF